jgi:hypothetical protein
MCVILTCARWLNNSSARWVELPTPDDPNESVPGFSLASAINSFTVFTPASGLTTSTVGVEVRSATGSKSFMMSNGRLLLVAALIMLAAEAT